MRFSSVDAERGWSRRRAVLVLLQADCRHASGTVAARPPMGGRRIGCSAFSEQRKLISKIVTWAEAGRPPGPSLVAGEGAEWAGEWLGTTMFFGQAGEDVALQEFSFAELRLRDKKRGRRISFGRSGQDGSFTQPSRRPPNPRVVQFSDL